MKTQIIAKQTIHPVSRILRDKFSEKQSKNSNYSLRAFARDLGVSAAYISQVFSGKKIPSVKRALQFCGVLNMNEKEIKQLLFSYQEIKNNFPKEKDLLSKTNSIDFINLEVDYLKFLENWYSIAIMDLTTIKGFKSDYKWIAKKLNISNQQVATTVERLLRLGFIKEVNKSLVKTNDHHYFPTDKSHYFVRNLHKQFIKKAIEVLENKTSADDFAKRNITGTTIAIDPSKMDQANIMIKEFRQKLATLLSEGNCTEVYQLNVQLFNLTN